MALANGPGDSGNCAMRRASRFEQTEKLRVSVVWECEVGDARRPIAGNNPTFPPEVAQLGKAALPQIDGILVWLQ